MSSNISNFEFENDENESSIELSPYDQHEPYTIIPNELIRDSSISPNCRWLIIYLSSNCKEWKIHRDQVYDHVKKFIGRDQVYGLFNEAIKAGYIKMEFYNNSRNLRRSKYIVSKFKKFFLRPEIQDTGLQDTANQDAFNIRNNMTNKYYSKEELHKECNSLVDEKSSTYESLPSSKKIKEKKPPSQEAMKLAVDFLLKIREIFPKLKQPKLEDWSRDFDLMKNQDKREWDDIHHVIDFIFEDSFWVKVIQSPSGLRRNFDKILAKMTPVDNSGTRIEINREIAIKIKNVLAQTNEHHKLAIFKNSVKNESTRDSIDLNLPSETFENILVQWFQLRKKNV